MSEDTSIIVRLSSLDAAVSIAGDQFTVPLSSDGFEPATHKGCNWLNCPSEISVPLSGVEGVTLSQTWPEALQGSGLKVIQPPEETA